MPAFSPSLARRLLHLSAGLALALLPATAPAAPAASWEQCGWGGGGFYYAAAYHPTKNGTIYLAGDVAGVYKTEDHGRHWRMINNGLTHYGVFTLAVDAKHPQTVYAATEGGLYQSLDEGEHWQFLPQTGPKELRLTGEKGHSIHCVAVQPGDGRTVYAGSPGGKVYQSTDAGQTWKVSYEPGAPVTEAEVGARVQFGKINDQYMGGLWLPLAFPASLKPADCTGIGLSIKGDKSQPRDCFLTLKTASGASFRSKNLNTLFQDDQLRDVMLKAEDFIVDPEYAKKNAEAAKALTAGPDWATVVRMDLAVIGPLPTSASVAQIAKVFFAGKAGAAVPVADLATVKGARSYGNIKVGAGEGGGKAAGKSVYSVVVTPLNPALVLAATESDGLVLSQDAGKSWKPLRTPKKATSAAFDPKDPKTIYGAFFDEGIYKSTDLGQSWTKLSAEAVKGNIEDVAVNPANAQDVYAISNVGWDGYVLHSPDGGKTWTSQRSITMDAESDPTETQEKGGATPLSRATNLVINPVNPKELYISANWRSCLSEDGGQTWAERNREADISCITDIRFHKGRTYVAVMDEGTLASDDHGAHWRQLWTKKYTPTLTGHDWRLAIDEVGGATRILSTVSPWESKNPPRVVVSADDGKSFKVVTEGLPDYLVKPNTMWGVGYPRALAVDPKDPQTVYLGIDGDAEPGKSGGGVFKSLDGGTTWKQLEHQPGARRMYYGLMVDPTNSQRIFWGACGAGGGLYRSDDAGGSWKLVFSQEQWIFNVLVTPTGTIYTGANNLFRSTDHGATWKQLTKFPLGKQIVGMEVDPRDPKTIYLSSAGGVFKSADDGATWQDITGNLPYRHPLVLRFDAETNELWAGGVGLFKMKQ